jgi:phosphoglycolate phosphatase
MTLRQSLIVFDCDGTLVDSQHLIVEAMRLSFQDAGLAAPERAAIISTIGLSIPDALRVLAPAENETNREDLGDAYREWYTALRKKQPAERLFPGAANVLFGLAAQEDVILGIATGKSRRGVDRFIDQNGLHGIFSTIQTADDAPSKPHPAMLMQAMAEVGGTPESTVMIGDTSYDMMMAMHAKATGIGVTWGYHSAAELQRSGAKSLVRSFSALEVALRELAISPQYVAVA